MAVERAIREVRFEGTHFERGLQRGRRLKGTLRVPDMGSLPDEFVDGCRAAAQELYPPAAEEFEGLVEGGGFERKAMEAYYFARLESRLGGCTMFAILGACRSDGQGLLVGRNYDWAVEDLRWCELHRYLPVDGFRRIGYTHHWAGCPDVLNEKGLYLAIASLPAEAVRAPGVQWSILVEMISERCATVAEAVALCAKVRHLRPMSYLVSDASGAAAVVEATPAQVTVRWPQDGLVVAANVSQGGGLLAQPAPVAAGLLPEPVGPRPDERSAEAARKAERRVRRAEELLRREMPTVCEAAVRTVLSDHEAPICTGDHRRQDGGRWATIWSSICAPAEGRFCIAPGLPCRHAYKAFALNA